MVVGTWHNIEFSSRTIVLGDIESDIVNEISEYILRINHIDNLNKDSKDYITQPIKLYINSYGGECYFAFGLIDIIESSITPIHTYGFGSVMSAALPIFLAGKERYAHKTCTFMYHQVSSEPPHKLKDQEESVLESKRIMTIFDKKITSKCKVTQKKLDEIKSSKKDWYFDSKEALKYKIIEKIL
jgi:ATP-dependent Clp protease protease subunit